MGQKTIRYVAGVGSQVIAVEEEEYRTFSKMKVVAKLMELGVWPQIKAWIQAQGLYDLYLAAQDFREDNASFSQGLAAIQTLLGWTDEKVEAVLAECVLN